MRSPDASRETSEELFRIQKALFREIRVFFWWWHSTYTILWKGERRKIIEEKTFIKIGHIRIQKMAQYKNTASLTQQLGETFGKATVSSNKNVVVVTNSSNLETRVTNLEGKLNNVYAQIFSSLGFSTNKCPSSRFIIKKSLEYRY